MTKRRTLLAGILILFLLACLPSEAIRNVCRECKARVSLEEVVCPNCGHPLNVCLQCKHQNPVSEDYCQKCFEPLAESRVLEGIASDVRQDLRLGESPRAVIERELSRLDHLLQIKPEKAEVFRFRRAKLLHQMSFYSREADAWKEFIETYPTSGKLTIAQTMHSEALRQWGYLFYSQKNPKVALAKFEEAVVANPANVEAWLWVARVRGETGNREGGREAYQKVLELDPKNSLARNFLRVLGKPAVKAPAKGTPKDTKGKP